MHHGNTLRSFFLLFLFGLLLAPAVVSAQRPKRVSVPPPPKDWQPGTAKMDCNDAGELEGFTGFQMQSTSFGDNLGPADVIPFGGQPDTIFLCAQDQFTLNHREGTEDLDGDPDDTSTPGVGYAFFRCTPTTRGPTIQDIVADACLADNGLPPFDTLAIAVPTGFDNAVPDYSITVANDGTGNNTIPALFPVGGAPSPVVLTLTPITFDEVIVATGNAGYETPAGGGMFGPCANARVDQSFQVAYLNPVTTANLGVDPSSACNGLFDVRGGTPELRGGTGYNIRIVNTATGREGVVLTPAADIVHDAVVRYQVPEAGTYEIIIEDENSCPLEMTTITHTEGCSLPVVFDFPFVTGENGQNICVDITAENFTDIAGFQFETAFDPAVVQYTGIANQHPDFSSPISANGPPSSGGTLPDGSVRITWSDFGASPLTIAADQTLFSLCFDIIGAEGEQTGLDFSQESGSIIPTFTRSGDPVMEDASSNPGAISITMDAFLLDLAREDESCIGSSDGSITATASGAPDPYTFSIRRLDTEINFRDPVTRSGNPAMATFSGLTVAQYAVRAEAADGGVVIDTIEVEEGIGIGVNIDVLNTPTCRGFSDAEIEAVVNDANGVIADPLAAGYTFTWADSDETGNIRTGLTSGIYNVTVVAPNGVCVANDQGQVAPASALRIRPDNPADAVSNATCSGAPDGSIEITADGGTGPYDFDWQGTLGVDNDVTMSMRDDLLPGEYEVFVIDDRGCRDTANFVVDALKTLGIVSEIDSISCFGAADGAIRVNGTASGAAPVGNYFVRLIDLDGPVVGPEQEITDNSAPFEFANLDEGRYVVVLRDNDPAGCETTDTFDIFEPALLEIDDDLAITNETCVVGMDGTVTATVTGGTEPYEYRWVNDSLDAPLDTITPGMGLTGLSADTNYVLIVTDDNGCTDTAFFRILAPAGALIQPIDTSFISCPGDVDGQLSVVATPPPGETITGITWYRLNDDGTLGAPVANGATTQDNLPVGNYAVEIISSNSCVAFAAGTVVSPGEVFLNRFVLNDPQCPDDANGNIFLEPAGGTPNVNGTYNYVWSTDPNGAPVTNPTRLNLTAGTYSVTITDGNGCQPGFDTTFVLTDPPRITGNFSIVDVSCPDDDTMDGSATFTAEYEGGGAGTFDFLWVPSGVADFSTTMSTEADLGRGPVTVRVTDGVCDESFTDTVRSPEEFTLELAREEVSCNGLSDGSATATVTGGTGAYAYAWTADPTEMTNVVSGIPAGAYQLVVTDENGCSPAPEDFVIREPDPLTLAFDPVQTTPTVQCAGDANGRIGVFVSSVNNNDLGNNPYTWSGNVAGTDESLARDLQPGTYAVTVTDVEGCQDSLRFTIGEPEPITFNVLPIEEPLCFGETTPVLIDTAFGGTSNGIEDFSFSVNNDGFRLAVGQTGSAFAGEIVVTVFDSVGCTAEQTFSVNQPPEILIDLPERITVELGDSLTQLNPLISPAGDVYEYLWTPDTYLSADTVRAPTIFPFESEDYLFRVTNANGCQAFADIFVEVDANRNVYIPNVFSPNRDGRNEDFRIFACQGVRAVRNVQVFDRWGGAILFESNLEPNCLDGIQIWDGRTAAGKPVNPGVFVYVIEVEFLDDTRLTYRGDVTVLR